MYYRIQGILGKVRLVEMLDDQHARVCDSTDAYRMVPVSRLVPIGNSKRLVE